MGEYRPGGSRAMAPDPAARHLARGRPDRVCQPAFQFIPGTGRAMGRNHLGPKHPPFPNREYRPTLAGNGPFGSENLAWDPELAGRCHAAFAGSAVMTESSGKT